MCSCGSCASCVYPVGQFIRDVIVERNDVYGLGYPGC